MYFFLTFFVLYRTRARFARSCRIPFWFGRGVTSSRACRQTKWGIIRTRKLVVRVREHSSARTSRICFCFAARPLARPAVLDDRSQRRVFLSASALVACSRSLTQPSPSALQHPQRRLVPGKSYQQGRARKSPRAFRARGLAGPQGVVRQTTEERRRWRWRCRCRRRREVIVGESTWRNRVLIVGCSIAPLSERRVEVTRRWAGWHQLERESKVRSKV